MVHDLSAVYPYLRDPLGPSKIFSYLPPELYGDFKRVVTELHRDIKIWGSGTDAASTYAFCVPTRGASIAAMLGAPMLRSGSWTRPASRFPKRPRRSSATASRPGAIRMVPANRMAGLG